MFIVRPTRYLLSLVTAALLHMPAAHASPLFDGTTADAWLIDTETGQMIGYDVERWLQQYNTSDFPGIVLDTDNAILINQLPNSSVPMSPSQPAISLAGIGDAAIRVGDAGQGGYSNLILSPQSDTYTETIAVTMQVSAVLLEQQEHVLKWTVGAQSQKSVSLTVRDLQQSQDGYYTKTVSYTHLTLPTTPY